MIWQLTNEENDLNFVKGCAVEFCQVVTQTRNIRDTSLKVKGEAAQSWMELAQCFAGKPEKPPGKGERYKKNINEMVRENQKKGPLKK